MKEKLTPNSTQIPNIILDKIIPQISEADGKCLLYICRRTFGFHRDRDRISLTQFTDGIKNNLGERLDYGTGLSRPAVIEALRNLYGSGLIRVFKTPQGNLFEMNTELLVENSVDNEVVKKVNQLRKLTKTSKESLPEVVNEVNTQKKGKKGNKDVIISSQNDDERPIIEKRVIPVGEPPEINQEGLRKLTELKEKVLSSSTIYNGLKT